jgi:hypothetical protein
MVRCDRRANGENDMTAAHAGSGDLTWSIGSAISTAGAVLVGHFLPFVATALIAAFPNVLFWLLVGRGAAPGFLTTAGIASMVVNTAVTVLLIQTLTYGTVQALRGRKVPIGDCLVEGLRRLPVGIAVGFLAYLGILLGMVLLIVPGFILLTMWSVALPANAVERTGVLASLSRSSELTRGRRWRAFGTIIVPVLITLLTSWLLIGLFGLRGINSETFQLLSWVIHAVEQAFSVCVFATLYYFLRREKEGVDIEQIAAVFD